MLMLAAVLCATSLGATLIHQEGVLHWQGAQVARSQADLMMALGQAGLC
jgi:hypothetical protein